jgi:hypothetical protein
MARCSIDNNCKMVSIARLLDVVLHTVMFASDSPQKSRIIQAVEDNCGDAMGFKCLYFIFATDKNGDQMLLQQSRLKQR